MSVRTCVLKVKDVKSFGDHIGHSESGPNPFICIVPHPYADKKHTYLVLLYPDKKYQVYRVLKDIAPGTLLPLFASQYSPQGQSVRTSLTPQSNRTVKFKSSKARSAIYPATFRCCYPC